MHIAYGRLDSLPGSVFIDVLRRSGLSERRPVEDEDRIGRMLRNSNLIVVASDQESGAVVGVARSLTDFSYCCYLSDLAVDKSYQRKGIGRRLIAETRVHAGPEAMCLLLSAPGVMSFYDAIGMQRAVNAFSYGRER